MSLVPLVIEDRERTAKEMIILFFELAVSINCKQFSVLRQNSVLKII